MKNIFADKATYVAREMLKNPNKKWVVRDFVRANMLSLGMAQEVLDAMEKKGYVERIKKGAGSYAVLTNKNTLIDDWVNKYNFDKNIINVYYNPDKYILNKIKKCLSKDQYALTLHSGANLITSFIKSENIYIYLRNNESGRDIIDIKQKLDLKQLVRGGNIYLIRPYYKNSVFYDTQNIKGYTVVSNLQLYLDLYNYQPRGREHADYFKRLLEEKGKKLD
jgi:hypothetical protein